MLSLLQVVVPWPQEFLQFEDNVVTPRDVFGNKLEALDSIRVDDEVFIGLLPARNPPWQVEISGFHDDNVESGRRHYLNLVHKARLKNFLGSHTLNIILDGSEGNTIILQSPPGWWPNRSHIVPHLEHSSDLMGDPPGSFRNETLHPDQLARIQHRVERALETTRFHRGSYDLSIRLGALALKGLKAEEIGKRYPVPSFQRSIDSGGVVECQVNKWSVAHLI